MTSRARSKYRVRTSRTSSASRSSANGVKPTRAANRTETTRRSATAGAFRPAPVLAGDAVATAAPSNVDGPVNGVAHWKQNLAPGGLVVPQDGQPAIIAVPHSMQNFASGRFSVAQFEQITWRLPQLSGRFVEGHPEHTMSGRAREAVDQGTAERSGPASPSAMGGDDLDDLSAVAGQAGGTHALHAAQGRDRRRAPGRDIDEQAVGRAHVGWDTGRSRGGEGPLAQGGHQRAVLLAGTTRRTGIHRRARDDGYAAGHAVPTLERRQEPTRTTASVAALRP